MSLDLSRIYGRIFGGADGGGPDEPQMPPVFTHLWVALEDELKRARVKLSRHVVHYPNTVEIFFSREDWTEQVAPVERDLEGAIDTELAGVRQRLGYPDDHVVVFHFVTADPDQIDVPRGQVRVVASSVANPWAQQQTWKQHLRRTTVTGPAAPAAAAIAPASETPLVRLSWEDARGLRKVALFEAATLGRTTEQDPADVLVDPGAYSPDNDAFVVSRRALELTADPLTRAALAVNHARVPILLESEAGRTPIAPGARVSLPLRCTLRWPAAARGPGFALQIEVPVDGDLQLRHGEQVLSVQLRAAVTHVALPAGTLGPQAIDLKVDLSQLADQRVLVTPDRGETLILVASGPMQLELGAVTGLLTLAAP